MNFRKKRGSGRYDKIFANKTAEETAISVYG